MIAHSPLRAVVLLAVALFAVAGCASDSDKPTYGGGRVSKPLDVPPDLTAPKADAAYPLPEVAPRSATLAGPLARAGAQGAGAAAPGVQLKRDGAVRWLDIQAPPAAVWTQAKHFLQKQGFQLALEAPQLGIMETEWREHRESVPGNFLTKLFSKSGAADRLDKYRIRLEQGETPQQTRLYLSYRGLQAATLTGKGGDAVEKTWEVRPADPELEAEMLQRLLLFLGEKAPAADKQLAQQAPQRSELVQQDGHPALQLDEGFARAWRRTELALDRVGVIVSDRNRDNGVYFIRIPDSYVAQQPGGERGFFASLFSGGADSGQRDFHVRVKAAGEGSIISIETPAGAPADPKFSQRLLQQIRENLA